MSESISILRKFIMEYGTILGLCWTAVFALYIIGFRTQSSLCMFLGLLGLIAVAVLEFYLGCRTKKRSNAWCQTYRVHNSEHERGKDTGDFLSIAQTLEKRQLDNVKIT